MGPRVTICSAFNVHYPTDSTLLQDGVRALTRTMHQGCAALGDPLSAVRNRLRSVARHVSRFGCSRGARSTVPPWFAAIAG